LSRVREEIRKSNLSLELRKASISSPLKSVSPRENEIHLRNDPPDDIFEIYLCSCPRVDTLLLTFYNKAPFLLPEEVNYEGGRPKRNRTPFC